MLIRKFKDLLIILKIQQEKTRGEFFFSFFLLEKSTQSFWSCNVLALFLLISLIFDQILKYIYIYNKTTKTQRIKKTLSKNPSFIKYLLFLFFEEIKNKLFLAFISYKLHLFVNREFQCGKSKKKLIVEKSVCVIYNFTKWKINIFSRQG